MLKLFQKKKEQSVVAPCNGEILPLEEVKDTMFSQKLLGDGFAIQPKNDVICAPCDGVITMIARTAHAFGITAMNDAQILVHVGFDTVNLDGKGFQVIGEIRQKVSKGTPILKLDLPFLRQQEADLTIPVVVTNGDDYVLQHRLAKGEAMCAQEIMSITKS